ncbi:hypothetical protein KSK37_13310 [Kaistella sp. DKR-2]|uniref:hypothetical protein n=1 Tax=Kaistella soli TaxID=2849654 RepID=UPI001C26E837|nr:hypothetical protein [Kaistella soli]MBU8884066.1 hypothetical protein [Kaistella soli]
MEENKVVKSFIEVFLAFYGVNELQNVKISKGSISGEAIWNDEPAEDNSQKFCWKINLSTEEIENMKSILEFIFERKLFHHDKISINEESLIKKLVSRGWSINNAKKTLDNIFETSIDMIDDAGKKEDAFFLHL